ncbi:adenosylmethionine decarboxylase [Yoonia maritima]|uniref:adenosylmethionine decarboxylase n=1 Tax=Yoonia maritima TaxID=1435347 RepID=UPI000D0F4369|nr:adenosylmethionine decarboxylase [Yoonia maritima]
MLTKAQTKPTVLGLHVIAEFFDAACLIDCEPAQQILHDSAVASGATVLEIKLHDFGDRTGFTGVALLAESHISIHTWPEHSYAAIDIFMCGDVDPLCSLDVLRHYFAPKRETVQLVKRGEVFVNDVGQVGMA